MKNKKILAIGAHPDDIELFCGGALMKLEASGCELYHLICTSGESKDGDRLDEYEKACGFLKIKENYNLKLNDSGLRHNRELVTAIDKIVSEVKPDWIFTHSENDHHQDHVAVAKATRSANRKQDATLITYPSYDLTRPFDANLFVDIDEYFNLKLGLLEIFESQSKEWYMQPEAVTARSTGTNIAKYVERFKIEMMRL